MKYDVIFIGGGPGGYVAAIKARTEGLKVALIEKAKTGGVCLHAGCIPTKALIAGTDIVHAIRIAKDFGVTVDNVSIDYAKMNRRKDEVVETLYRGVESLLKAHDVHVFSGEGSFLSPTEIKIKGKESQIITGKNVVIATGSISATIPGCVVDGKQIHDSTSILKVTSLPKKLTILGAGYIGCEFASLFSELGVKVTMVELFPGIVWTQGKGISKLLTEAFQKKGIELRCGVKMESCKTDGHQVTLSLSDGSTVISDMLLVSVGRKPYTENLHLNAIGLGTNDRGYIEVNDKMETSVPGIYAIGDVTGQSMLAHVASHQGILAVDRIAGKKVTMHYEAVPAVIFTHPEIATVGYTLEQAKEKGYDASSALFPFTALGKARASGDTEGQVEIVFERTTFRILGAFAVGHNAGTLIAEMTLAIHNELTLESLSDTIHAHPTLPEAWMEAALLAQGYPIHLPPRK